jgi:hypothetical protein
MALGHRRFASEFVTNCRPHPATLDCTTRNYPHDHCRRGDASAHLEPLYTPSWRPTSEGGATRPRREMRRRAHKWRKASPTVVARPSRDASVSHRRHGNSRTPPSHDRHTDCTTRTYPHDHCRRGDASAHLEPLYAPSWRPTSEGGATRPAPRIPPSRAEMTSGFTDLRRQNF